MNDANPKADPPVPPQGTEQAADQAAQQQQAAEPGALDTVASVIDGVTDVAGLAIDILTIFD